MPPEAERARVAEVVYQELVRTTGGDGHGLCLLYAQVAAVVLPVRYGPRTAPAYGVMAGSCAVQHDPDDEVWTLHVADDGGIERGEFHAWAGRAHPDGRIEVVDLSARHWPAWASGHGGWRRRERPAYLWAWETDLPPWVRFKADLPTTMALRQASAEARALDVVGAVARRVLARVGRS